MQRSTWERDLIAADLIAAAAEEEDRDEDSRPSRGDGSHAEIRGDGMAARNMSKVEGEACAPLMAAPTSFPRASGGIAALEGAMQHMPKLQELVRLRDAILSQDPNIS